MHYVKLSVINKINKLVPYYQNAYLKIGYPDFISICTIIHWNSLLHYHGPMATYLVPHYFGIILTCTDWPMPSWWLQMPCRKIDIRSSTTTMPIRLSLTTMLMTHVSQYRYTMLQPQYKLCSGEIWIIFNWPAHERHFAVIVPGNQDIDSSQEIAEVDALLLQPWLTAPPPGDVVVFTVLYNINNFQSTTFQP